jgi:L-lactate dehydrogenase complex protein LldG
VNAKDAVLQSIRAARADVPGSESPGSVAIPRDYLTTRPIPGGADGLIDRFCERVADYRAEVEVVAPQEVSAAVGRALAAVAATQVGVPAGLPAAWLPEGVTVYRETAESPLDIDALQALHAVVTGVAVGIAETGTVVLDGRPECGRRALHLVPDLHVCVVHAADVVDDVPAAVARLGGGASSGPLTWISGPSATSDIELNRVEGVHGPRRLHVILTR